MSAVPSLRPVPTAGPVPVPRQAARSDGSILAALGVAGMDHLEPVFVAALVTEKPLLLIGPHGTGKSWLLVRLAEALVVALTHASSHAGSPGESSPAQASTDPTSLARASQ